MSGQRIRNRSSRRPSKFRSSINFMQKRTSKGKPTRRSILRSWRKRRRSRWREKRLLRGKLLLLLRLLWSKMHPPRALAHKKREQLLTIGAMISKKQWKKECVKCLPACPLKSDGSKLQRRSMAKLPKSALGDSKTWLLRRRLEELSSDGQAGRSQGLLKNEI